MFVLITNFSRNEKKPFLKSCALEFEESGRYTYAVLKLKHKKSVNSKKISTLVGNMPVLISKDLRGLAYKNFNFANNTAYKKSVFENGIKVLFKEKRFNATVTLIDIKCRYQQLADSLINNFKAIRIITSDLGFYKEYSSVKRNACGAVAVVSNRLELYKDSAFVVAPDGIFFDIPDLPDTTIISIDGLNNLKARIKASLHSFKAEPQEGDFHIPSGLSKEDYLAALYYHCGARENTMLIPSTVTINNCEETISNVKKALTI